LTLPLPFPVVVGENCLGGTKDTPPLVGVSIRPVLVFEMVTLGGESGEGGKKSSGYCNIESWLVIYFNSFISKTFTSRNVL